jgi:hypothetical protein
VATIVELLSPVGAGSAVESAITEGNDTADLQEARRLLAQFR